MKAELLMTARLRDSDGRIKVIHQSHRVTNRLDGIT